MREFEDQNYIDPAIFTDEPDPNWWVELLGTILFAVALASLPFTLCVLAEVLR